MPSLSHVGLVPSTGWEQAGRHVEASAVDSRMQAGAGFK